jgi:hypothetical protein
LHDRKACAFEIEYDATMSHGLRILYRENIE